MSRILFIDVETGGLDPEKHSLLSIGLAVWIDGEIVHSTEIYIQEEEYVVTSKALDVNKIDIIQMGKIGIPPLKALSVIYALCSNFFPDLWDPKKLITLAGHNVAFDVAFLKKLFSRTKQYRFESIFSYKTIDTATVAQFLYHSGLMSPDLRNSNQLFSAFGIENTTAHNALSDVLATANLYNKMLGMARGFIVSADLVSVV